MGAKVLVGMFLSTPPVWVATRASILEYAAQVFLSTPPVWVATLPKVWRPGRLQRVSIHATRVGGDLAKLIQ